MHLARTTFVLATAAALGFSAAPAPQDFDDLRARIRATAELVVVPVTVKDARGEFVLDIRPEEFRIFEDGVEQQLELHTLESFPLSAVLLLDSALPARTAERVSESLGAIAGSFAPWDEAAVMLFEDETYLASAFLTGSDELIDRLSRLMLTGTLPPRETGPPTGPTVGTPRPESTPQSRPSMQVKFGGRRSKHLDDAMHDAAELLAPRPRDRRKLLLAVTDGENARQNRITFDAALRSLLSAEVTVYAVRLTGRSLFGRSADALERYARLTGGEVFTVSDRASLEPVYARALEQSRTQYTLAYIPQRAARTRDFHSIEVRVRRPGLTVRARDGYYTPPAAP
jgi:VWFA-related protein